MYEKSKRREKPQFSKIPTLLVDWAEVHLYFSCCVKSKHLLCNQSMIFCLINRKCLAAEVYSIPSSIMKCEVHFFIGRMKLNTVSSTII